MEDQEDAIFSPQSPRKYAVSPRKAEAGLRPSSAPIDRVVATLQMQKPEDMSTRVAKMYPGAIVLPRTFTDAPHHRVGSTKPVAEILREFRLRPAACLPILHHIIVATFDTPCIWVDRHVDDAHLAVLMSADCRVTVLHADST